jgi:lipopolysaccharide assembly outer membrane protein LptD (OstA)
MVNMASYQLDSFNGQKAENLSRTVPTFSLDSGLVFERDVKFGGKDMTQTLEPRLFYVNTPYRDQSRSRPSIPTRPPSTSARSSAKTASSVRTASATPTS